MKKVIRVLAIVVCAAMCVALCACSSGSGKAVDLNSKSLDDIIAGAKKEGVVESVGMPDSWANWGLTWKGIKDTYGINHNDADMSSAEELSTFQDEGTNGTKDIGDVGQAFGATAIDMGVVQSYKTSYWDSVPDWAKDKDGNWMMAYTGVTSFITNTDLVKNAPKSWADVKNGTYKMTIGDVVTGATGQGVVLATAYAFGGDMEKLDPAFDFWKKLAADGRIDQGDILLQRIQAGEVEVGVTWSFNVFSYRDNTPNYKFDICIPTDGAIMAGYASVINKNAPHPYAAALAREYIFSDEGQNNLAAAGAIPTRTDVKISEEIQKATFAPSAYANATPIKDNDAYAKARETIASRWQEEVIPLMS